MFMPKDMEAHYCTSYIEFVLHLEDWTDATINEYKDLLFISTFLPKLKHILSMFDDVITFHTCRNE